MRIAKAIRSLILAAVVSAVPAASFAGVFVSIGIGAPPVLPVYVQPPVPAPGYIWTPGYWSYADDGGYYWVPGAWVLAPYPGALWTPGYWAYSPTGYAWSPGYWGLHIGFYGGVNYGFGYGGRGFEGGYWDRGVFRYNTAIVHVDDVRFHNVVYNRTVVVDRNASRASFNGGHGGIDARPTADEQRWSHEQHTAPLAAQHQNELHAGQNRAQFANVNHGRPENLAHAAPVSYNRNTPANNNRPAANQNFNRPQANQNNNRPAANENFNRPQGNNYNASRPPTQTYHPQPQPTHTAPQSHSEPAHNNGGGHESGGHEGGHDGGHGGHGR
ncbi:MAG TPA: hypothetical protein VE218_01515 [Acidobacteriaceae bacterium]|nr:hypothetical protein [Acidobacteriaceae bacterium]